LNHFRIFSLDFNTIKLKHNAVNLLLGKLSSKCL
jgi:hypothetical protein